MKYEEMSQKIKDLLLINHINWNSSKKIYMTKLHKNFYLNEREVKSEGDLVDFCRLVKFLQEHLEYGVNTVWASSGLNKYIYTLNKEDIKKQFPSAIDALSRFYNDSDIINFYKDQGAKLPTLVDLLGTTGAGKTTFCQQLVDDVSKDILGLTITESGESTVIQTDILVLEKTKKKMFLKVRNKAEIMKDIIAVALDLDLNSDSNSIKNSLKKSEESRDKDVVDKVNNYFSTPELLNKFKELAVNIQNMYKSSDCEKFAWIQASSINDELCTMFEETIEDEFDKTDFYGYRQEYNLETNAENIVLRTLANKVFQDRKEDLEEYPEMIKVNSLRLLFDHAILVLPCSNDAKKYLKDVLQQGIVLRDSQGHKLDEQNGIASDIEVKNKIFLIPVDSGGYLIDDRYSSLFEKILISEPKNSLFVLTKVDILTAYKKYKKSDYKDEKNFHKVMKDKIANTHNKLINNFFTKPKTNNDEESAEFYKDETIHFYNFMKAFDNTYLTEIDDSSYASEAHKINYKGNSLEELDKSKLEIVYLNSWFEILGSMISQNKLTYYSNITRKANVDSRKREKLIKYSSTKMMTLVEFYSSTEKYQSQLDVELGVFNRDLRSIYQRGYIWFYSNFRTEGSTTITDPFFKDLTANFVRTINSYTIKDDGANYIIKLLQNPLNQFLQKFYSSKLGDSDAVLKAISAKIISNTIEKSIKASYKIYDRGLEEKNHFANLRPLWEDKHGEYVKPTIPFNKVVAVQRPYGTYTEYFAGIYCNLQSKFKYNLATHFLDIFTTILECELKELDEKVK